MKAQEYVTPFEEYWTFGRLDGQWKLKEVLPPGRGEKAVDLEKCGRRQQPRSASMVLPPAPGPVRTGEKGTRFIEIHLF